MLKKLKRWFRRPRDPSGHVYYARLRTAQGTFYKVGFTSKSTLMERMAYGNTGDERLIEREFFFTFRADAWDVEQTLLDHFDKQRAFGRYSNDPAKPLCGRGQSELFTHDVLGLDNDLYSVLDESALKTLKDEHEDVKDGCFMVLIGLVLAPFTLGFSLLFILGGVSGIFGAGKSGVTLKQKKRPVHPAALQKLIDELYYKKLDENG
ncbi:hypothetical protein [Marinobacter sp. F4206]|uniref:hypothetical protein n=1 Tax=Marinobacter sp. F4206 TaxID=2861777 RepID=UPI001C5E1A80|nr:hypothetical protein [Marinobacter sp. F4206]MBW4934193.1 hypothetical protein [Marinobacter sp. F4206]